MSEIGSQLQRIGVRDDALGWELETPRVKSGLLRFGVFELDVMTGELRRDGRLIHLRHQPVSVLRLLLERAGDLVTRREITSSLWPDDVDVDVEQGLNHCMKEIRAALGDRPESPRFIQTLPRRGYRFLAEVREEPRRSSSAPAKTQPMLAEGSTASARKTAAAPEPDDDTWLGDGRFE